MANTTVKGMVNIHDKKISLSASHLTLDNLSPAPAPTIDILTTWVVLTGPPSIDDKAITVEDANCEVKL